MKKRVFTNSLENKIVDLTIKLGATLHSINHGFKFLSIKISKPKSSKQDFECRVKHFKLEFISVSEAIRVLTSTSCMSCLHFWTTSIL